MTNPCGKETEIALMQQSMNIINKNIETLGDKIDKGFENIDSKFENLEKKFASKWVERLIVFVGGVMGASIIGSFMYLILR